MYNILSVFPTKRKDIYIHTQSYKGKGHSLVTPSKMKDRDQKSKSTTPQWNTFNLSSYVNKHLEIILSIFPKFKYKNQEILYYPLFQTCSLRNVCF